MGIVAGRVRQTNTRVLAVPADGMGHESGSFRVDQLIESRQG